MEKAIVMLNNSVATKVEFGPLVRARMAWGQLRELMGSTEGKAQMDEAMLNSLQSYQWAQCKSAIFPTNAFS